MKRVVVLGASGMLGSMLVKYLSQHYMVVATVRDRKLIKPVTNVEWRLFDATDLSDRALSYIVKDSQWVINAIGIIKQKMYTVKDDMAVLVNSEFSHLLARVAEKHAKHIIQIATDCVYSGNGGYYNEESIPDPPDLYGLTKMAGEVISPNVHHLRCSIVGPSRDNYSLLQWFLSQPQSIKIDGYPNNLWNGITTLAFAKICHGIIKHNPVLPHCQHIVPGDTVNKWELLNHFAKYYGRQDLTITPWEASQPVDRRLSTCNPTLNRFLWAAAGYIEPPTVKDMVKELSEYESNDNTRYPA